MSKTEEYLKEAFAGESQANRKYLAFAKKADQEGYPMAARLFRAAAAAETVHAHAHLKVLGGIKSTRENLMEAISGETHEFEHMYPEMIAAATAEGNTQAKRSFEYANEVEKVHAALYQKMLNNLENQAMVEVYICPICGWTVEGEVPEKCPVCKTLKKFFERID
ncbi:rubrerythrin family protein [Desulfobacca acetoxidans]|uniref:Rubrerythrin n=1 Tax=Desulfobacca acetoxidans (strain ATCC 700848 / DSM 11109 / ASRB2) TaxID=880072 RepID=F2NDC7_DESAR|nr:rubrerythrin family protein [Desulfobacca acetoxidans]AEB09993.1 Rubrerythrin [Desulfobacca acetoxidans DSM 11109]